ncbi:hypothetical protein BU15DRAFT_71728 [Melanogaster broomeanus]|nr:hypothetical protein BU15DRAFT_71728 [Melanogaster broomeanus]
MAIETVPQIDENQLPQLSSLISAHYLEIACFTLLVYDYVLTLGQEVEHFWTGSWTSSRILFLLNRYIPFGIMIFLTTGEYLCFRSVIPTDEAFPKFYSEQTYLCSCTHTTRIIFFSSIFALCINQGQHIQLAFDRDPALTDPASSSHPSPPRMVHVPSQSPSAHRRLLQLRRMRPGSAHTHGAKHIRIVFHANQLGHIGPRLLCASCFGSLEIGFEAALDGAQGSVADEASPGVRAAWYTSSPWINYPAYSNLTLVVNAVAVSRLMLSARSLAGKLRTDPRWLLNPTELGRVNWRYVVATTGAEDEVENYGYDIMVEQDTYEPPETNSSSVSLASGSRATHLWGL